MIIFDKDPSQICSLVFTGNMNNAIFLSLTHIHTLTLTLSFRLLHTLSFSSHTHTHTYTHNLSLSHTHTYSHTHSLTLSLSFYITHTNTLSLFLNCKIMLRKFFMTFSKKRILGPCNGFFVNRFPLVYFSFAALRLVAKSAFSLLFAIFK